MRKAIEVLLCLGLLAGLSDAFGMKCENTLYAQRNPGVTGVLINSWKFYSSSFLQSSGYEPRSKNYKLEPDKKRGNNASKNKYNNLDWFATSKGFGEREDFLTVDLNRRALVYLFMFGKPDGDKTPELEGWNQEGWVKRQGSKYKMKVGVDTRISEFGIPREGFLFYKNDVTSVKVPEMQFVRKIIKNMDTSGEFALFFAETNGSPPAAPTGNAKNNQAAVAGKICPEWLHDEWVVAGFDRNDPLTNRMNFRTYHPILDPCFLCSYGHDHGSNAPTTMGYWPRYGYTALKNNNEDEAHAGFSKLSYLVLKAHRFLTAFAQRTSYLTLVTIFYTTEFMHFYLIRDDSQLNTIQM